VRRLSAGNGGENGAIRNNGLAKKMSIKPMKAKKIIEMAG